MRGRVWLMAAAAAAFVPAVPGIEPWTAPAEDAARPNAVSPSPESVARGREIFLDLCAPCHGEDGSGDPDMEEALEVEVGDLSPSGSLDGRTDGELHWRIRSGGENMPAFSEDIEDMQIWDLVNYLRVLGRAAPPPDGP